jgi:hypothetical protein
LLDRRRRCFPGVAVEGEEGEGARLAQGQPEQGRVLVDGLHGEPAPGQGPEHAVEAGIAAQLGE